MQWWFARAEKVPQQKAEKDKISCEGRRKRNCPLSINNVLSPHHTHTHTWSQNVTHAFGSKMPMSAPNGSMGMAAGRFWQVRQVVLCVYQGILEFLGIFRKEFLSQGISQGSGIRKRE